MGIMISFLVQDSNAFQNSILRKLQHMQIVVPPGNRVVLGKQILAKVNTSSKDNGVKLSILNSQARMLPAQLYKRIVLRSEKIYIRAQLPISTTLVIRHVLQEFLTSQKQYIEFIDLKCNEAWSEVERVGKEVTNGNIFPLIGIDIVFLYVDFLIFGNTEAVDGVIEGSCWLMRLYGMQGIDFRPFLHLEGIANASFGPLALFDHASDEVDEFVVVD